MVLPGARLAKETDVLHLEVLGPPVVRWNARVVSFRSRKEFGLLVYLALTGAPQPREHLASMFWPDHHEAAARNMLRSTLSRLRQHLAVAGGTTAAALPVLRAEQDALGREVLGLAATDSLDLTLDVTLLTAVASALDGAKDGASEAQLQAAAAAYRGPFLAGVRFEDAPEMEIWVEAQRVYWQGRVESLLSRLASQQLSRRSTSEASATARRWLALDALSEPAYLTLMRALAATGDRAGALAVYQECRDVLQEQLGVDPSPETVALAERLRRLLPRAPADDSALRSAGPGSYPVALPFVGREREMAALVAAYQAARTGHPQLVIVAGEAGSGKTRLIEEFLRWATVEGADVLHGQGDEARGEVPYQMLVNALRPRLAREHAPDDLVADVWLSELVRLFPELCERYPDLPSPTALAGDGTAGPARLFEAVHMLLLALAERAKPAALVLCYDDVQWADLAMRDLLLYRQRRQREAGAPQLLVLTVRTEALAAAPDLEDWLGRLSRQCHAIRLRLGSLTAEEIGQALGAVLAEPTAAEGEDALQLGPWLLAQSDGQPFFLVELLRALVDQGFLVPLDGDRESGTGATHGLPLALAPGVDRLPHLVPVSVYDLIRSQLSGLSSTAFDVLAAAAVLGTDATFERLCLVADVDERPGLAALDELARRLLLLETGGPTPGEQAEAAGSTTLRFVHDLVREVVYTEAGEARRRLFHRRTFALLDGTGAPAATVARHAQAAGLLEPALRARVEAGDAALAVFAASDARTHYEQARQLLASRASAGSLRRQDWEEAPALQDLQGRTQELASLIRWVREEHCRVVAVLGAVGIGKTALVARMAHELADEFEVVSWRSLRNAPPPEEWLTGVIALLSAGQAAPPEGVDSQIRLLVGLLRTRRALLILDNLETVLEPGTPALRYRVGYEGYGEALRQLSERAHQGCVLLTSREQPLRGDIPAMAALYLDGLRVADARALLQQRVLTGDESAWQTLVERYGGNPLALQVVADTIEAVFAGEIAGFLAQDASVFGNIRQALDEQVARLSPLEQSVLTWVAVEREPVGFGELVADIGLEVARADLVEAVEALRRRSMLESKSNGSFTLPPMVLEYVTAQLVARAAREVLVGEPWVLVSHALVKASAQDFVRQSQERLIARPLLQHVRMRCGSTPAAVQRMLDLLETWRGRPRGEQGYGPGNVVNLLRLLRGELRGLDLSHLSIRQAYLQEVEAQDASLAGAALSEAVLGETFDAVTSLAVAPDGTRIAAGTVAGEVLVWRVADRALLLAVRGHTGVVNDVAFSADGRTVASGSNDGTIRLWDADAGRLLTELAAHTGAVHGVACSADGKTVVSGGEDRMVRLWDAGSGRCLAVLAGHTGIIDSVACSADGNTVVSGGEDAMVRLWDAGSNRCLAVLAGHTGVIYSVACSADGKTIASGGFDGIGRLWDAGSGRCLALLEGHTAGIRSVALSGDGQLAASGGLDRSVHIWEAPSGRSLAILSGHTGEVWGVGLRGDGRMVVSGGTDGTVRLWEVQGNRPTATLHGRSDGIWGLAFSSDGQVVASGSLDGTVRLWDLGGRPVAAFRGHTGGVYGVALSVGGLLAAGCHDGTVRLWETASGRLQAVLRDHTGGVWSVTFSADGKIVASGSVDGTVRLSVAEDGRALSVLRGHTAGVAAVAFSPDSRRLASGSHDGTVRLWEVPSGRPLITLRGHTGVVLGVAFSADGRTIASGSVDGTARLWNVEDGHSVVTLPGHTGGVYGVTLSASGWLAAGCHDGTVRLWEAASGRHLASLIGHSGGVVGVAFSADGRAIASGSLDGTVKLWDAANFALLRTMRPDRRYERMDITGLTGVTEAQRMALLGPGRRGATRLIGEVFRRSTGVQRELPWLQE